MRVCNFFREKSFLSLDLSDLMFLRWGLQGLKNWKQTSQKILNDQKNIELLVEDKWK